MTIVVGFTVALMGFIIGKFYSPSGGKFDELMMIALLSVGYLVIILLILGKNFDPTEYYTTGAEPETFFCDEILNQANKEDRLKTFYCNEIEEYQYRIELNQDKNGSRWKDFNIGLFMFKLFTVAILAIGAIVHWLW